MKRLFTILLLGFASVVLAQTIAPKICNSCGKQLSQCKYKGRHPAAVADSEKRKNTQYSNSRTNRTKVPNLSQTKISYNNDVLSVGDITYAMISVYGGTFSMGATSEMSNPYDDEKPTHQVTIRSFKLGETEVTQALWVAVMGSNPSYWKGDNLPVEQISWDDCQDFIHKLNQKTGKNFCLPTEAEWEYAARGGYKSKHFQYSGSDYLGDVAWYEENSGNKTHPVKMKHPNELGLFDMCGNVSEWCQDGKRTYLIHPQTDPQGSTYGRIVIRGGSWYSKARSCRSSSRFWGEHNEKDYTIGLRLALIE